MKLDKLIDYLTKDFHDKKYPKKSIIFIFLNDKKYYHQLIKRGAVNSSAHNCLLRKKSQFQGADSIREEAFRKLKYEEIITKYYDNIVNRSPVNYAYYEPGDNIEQRDIIDEDPSSTPKFKKTYDDKHKDVYINLRCPFDKNKMPIKKLRYVYPVFGKKKTKREIPFPVYQCSKCHNLFTSINVKDKQRITIHGNTYINLLPGPHSADYIEPQSINVRRLTKGFFYIHDVQEMKPKVCINPFCNNNHSFYHGDIVFKNKDGKKCLKTVYQCRKCNAYYISLNAYNRLDFPYTVVNLYQIPEIEDSYRSKLEEKAEKKRLKAEKRRLADEQRVKAEKEKAERQQLEREALAEAKRKAKIEAEEKAKHEKAATLPIDDLIQINPKDFVVRRSIFKCMHNNHDIQDIIAAVMIIDRKGNDRKIRVNAGFCPTCKVFFVLESTYEKIKRQGIPLCRVSDEKTYLKNITINGMRLASESILMQYGYNVNKEENLTSTMRQKILATLIDKHIMRKSEIISYLDFFISQRESQSRYQSAIAKWEMDREFVEDYKMGRYEQYGVQGLKR